MEFTLKPHLFERVLNDKERKNLLFLDIIRKNGPISRTDIANLTGFNIVTVSNHINHYIEKGVAFEKELDVSTGGRKPVLVSLHSDIAYVAAVGVNPESVVGVIVNFECRVIDEVRRERTPKNNGKTVDEILAVTRELFEKTKVERKKIAAIGIGLPGVIDEKNRTIRWPGTLGTEDFFLASDVKGRFESEFKIPVLIENDANLSALAERFLGLGREIRHLVYMFSGVGMGILVDGEIYRGASGVAGEIGVMSEKLGEKEAADEKFVCSLGRWDRDLGMIHKFQERSKKTKDAAKKNDMTLGDFIKLVKAGDPVAQEVAKECGELLGRKIAFVLNLLNPEIVIIGGGIEECGSVLLDAVKAAVKEWAISEAAAVCKILPAVFGEKAVALGAAANVCRELYAQV